MNQKKPISLSYSIANQIFKIRWLTCLQSLSEKLKHKLLIYQSIRLQNLLNFLQCKQSSFHMNLQVVWQESNLQARIDAWNWFKWWFCVNELKIKMLKKFTIRNKVATIMIKVRILYGKFVSGVNFFSYLFFWKCFLNPQKPISRLCSTLLACQLPCELKSRVSLLFLKCYKFNHSLRAGE